MDVKQSEPQDDSLQHVEKSTSKADDTGFGSHKVFLQDAEDSVAVEHQLTPLQAIKAYPMAIFWCLVISTCVIMEGYDQILVQSFYEYPQFQLKYGEDVGIGPTGHQVSAAWQAGLTNASAVGAFFGTLASG